MASKLIVFPFFLDMGSSLERGSRFKVQGSGSFDCGFGISDFGLKRPDGADTGYGLVPIVLVVVLVPRPL